MNIFETIAKVAEVLGYEKQNEVMIQLLTQGDRNISIQKRDAKITFYTQIEKGQDLMRLSGERQFTPVLLWLPKEALDKAIKQEDS